MTNKQIIGVLMLMFFDPVVFGAIGVALKSFWGAAGVFLVASLGVAWVVIAVHLLEKRWAGGGPETVGPLPNPGP